MHTLVIQWNIYVSLLNQPAEWFLYSNGQTKLKATFLKMTILIKCLNYIYQMFISQFSMDDILTVFVLEIMKTFIGCTWRWCGDWSFEYHRYNNMVFVIKNSPLLLLSLNSLFLFSLVVTLGKLLPLMVTTFQAYIVYALVLKVLIHLQLSWLDCQFHSRSE